ncbi:response regulator [Pedobacter psychrodurus]|uniref:Response regulator n=1 Tax=Pedobacter psychrodurus TaxID=2530456 RepID=A0A4R0PQK7_9SPHI|nr:response regulator [Pedobacter psychrodurus]TCD21772.1 response regulator [Pedobacter psychrodurus]
MKLNSIIDVLIVDDQAMDQKRLSDYLKEYDVSFAVAGNANEAMESLADYTFKLILIAADLLENDSYNIVQKIRTYWSSDISIVAIIEKDLEELKSKCFTAGLNGCFTKPISRIELVGVLTQFLPKEALPTKNIQVKNEGEGY